MMYRILSFSVDDFLVDRQAVEDSLNKACRERSEHYRLRGVCQVDRDVHLMLTPLDTHEELDESYVVAPVEDVSFDGFTSMIEERWASGFDIVGVVRFESVTFGVYARKDRGRA